MLKTNKDLFLEYYAENGKNGMTWKELGDMFGLTERMARYYGEQATPTADDIELGETDPFNGWTPVRATKTVSGGISYSMVPPKETIDYEAIIKSITFPRVPSVTKKSTTKNRILACIADVHVGMDTRGTMFQSTWNEQTFYDRIDYFIDKVPSGHPITLVQLGDYCDGERGKTASNTHKLEQNMSDADIFRVGLQGAVRLIQGLRHKSGDNLEVLWVSNSNHPTVVDRNIGTSLEVMFPELITVMDDAFNRHRLDEADLLVTHGKDRQFMKNGLPRFLGAEHKTRIEKLVSYWNMENPLLLRGDLHQASDISYSNFRDIMVPAFSPASGYVAVNFASNAPGGFTLIELSEPISITTHTF